MQLFSTVLKIDGKMTKDDFIRLVIEWNQTSPYPENVIPNLTWNGEYNVRCGTDRLWLDIEELKKQQIVAVRYEKHDADGVIWDTDYIMNFKEMKMAIRLDRSYLEEALKVDPAFSTPHFITMLIKGNYLKKDHGMDVLRTPLLVNKDNAAVVTDFLQGKSRYRLPLVLIVKTADNKNPVDVKRLAGRLKGAAHVLVWEDSRFWEPLREACPKLHFPPGCIDIYFPNQAVGQRRYLYRQGQEKQLLEKIIATVIQYANAQLIDPLYTWAGVNSAIYQERYLSSKAEYEATEKERRDALHQLLTLQSQRKAEAEGIREQALADAKREADKILDSFDDDMKKLQEENAQLRSQVERLEYENQGLRVKIDSNTKVPVLSMGTEDDFYPGEIKDLLLKTLSEKLESLPKHTRRYDVVKDIIDSNDYQKISEQRAAKVKALLSSYRGMTPKVTKGLKEVGFEITHDGGHYKTIYYGDDRYIVVHAATPSDGRAGKNNAADTIKKVF